MTSYNNPWTVMDREKQLEQAEEQKIMAGYAQQILANPAYKYALTVMRGDLIQKISKVPVQDVENLQELRRMIGTLDRFEEVFERLIISGKIAEDRIAKLLRILGKKRNK